MIDSMMSKSAARFESIELTVELKNIITVEDDGKITLVFYSPSVKNEYRKTYDIEDVKGRVDFTRAMHSLGSTKNNYGRWLNKIMTMKIPVKITVNGQGFIRFIRVLEKELREKITKSILIDSIEGIDQFTEDEVELLMSLSLKELRKDFGV